LHFSIDLILPAFQVDFSELCGESSDVKSETTEEWVGKLPSYVRDMNLKT
jgi:hypothetical protein